MIQRLPPTTALPDDVLALMHRIIELIDLLYWAPVPKKGSKGEAILARRVLLKRQNSEISSNPCYVEKMSSEDNGGEDLPTPTKA